MKFKLFDKARDKRILKVLLVFIFLIASVMVIYNGVMSEDYSDAGDYASEESEASCNVAGINLHGELLTYVSPADEDKDGYSTEDQTESESLMQFIGEAEADDSIKAIVMEVDSTGGSPVAGEEISLALKNAQKPTVVFIRESGSSAAYFAASAADKIYASKYSDVGSIGVTMSYLDYSRQNQKAGQTYNQLSAGKFKDAGDPDKNLSSEEKALFMRDINIMHQNLIKEIAENRKLDIQKVEAMADGSTMLGEMALKNGLIDAIGGYPEVKQYLKETIGEDPEVCWY